MQTLSLRSSPQPPSSSSRSFKKIVMRQQRYLLDDLSRAFEVFGHQMSLFASLGVTAVGEPCDKNPQKQGLVLPHFIHAESRVAIGETVGQSDQDADAGDPAGSLRSCPSLRLMLTDSKSLESGYFSKSRSVV